jgi:hypothetical protein
MEVVVLLVNHYPTGTNVTLPGKGALPPPRQPWLVMGGWYATGLARHLQNTLGQLSFRTCPPPPSIPPSQERDKLGCVPSIPGMYAPSRLMNEAPVRSDLGTPHSSAIMLLAESDKCPEGWGRRPQEHSKIRRHDTQFQTEISMASPKCLPEMPR